MTVARTWRRRRRRRRESALRQRKVQRAGGIGGDLERVDRVSASGLASGAPAVRVLSVLGRSHRLNAQSTAREWRCAVPSTVLQSAVSDAVDDLIAAEEQV